MSDLNLYKKLLKVSEEVGKIEKTGKNLQQNYLFIEQAKVVAELRPKLASYGIVIVPETVSRTIERYTNAKGGISVHANVVSRYTVINADNPEERFVCEWDGGEAIDTSDKATNKATTASQKYFLMKLFNISDQDDADAVTPEPPRTVKTVYDSSTPLTGLATPKQKALIKKKLEEVGIPLEDMQGYLIEQFGITDTERMTKDDASHVIDSLIGASA